MLRIGSRWEADWRSLGSGSAVVGKRIGHRSRLSGRAAEGDGEVEAPNFNISNKSGTNHERALMASIFKNIEWNEEQDVGFSNLINNRDFIVAFLSLVVVAPIVEEIIFRGWLYGKLRARIPALPAILAVSALFGFVHL